jgi:GT2 family glycosyltransferase
MLYKKYTIYIISDTPFQAKQCKKSIDLNSGIVIDANKYDSYSEAINNCVTRSPTEIVIICQDRIRPTKRKIARMVELLESGYGIVAMHRLRFFGLKKNLLRKIGMFDERYVGNDYEDFDMLLRLKESDIAYYESEEVKYVIGKISSWGHEAAKEHHFKKWRHGNTMYVRLLTEKSYPYKLGTGREETKFLPWTKSILMNMSSSFLHKPVRAVRKKKKKKSSFWGG